MKYYLNLFSPSTYEAFKHSNRDVSGFTKNQRAAAEKLSPGDRLVCYLTKLGRWFGILEVIEGPFVDDAPIFQPRDDPYVVRFKVRPLFVLDTSTGLAQRHGQGGFAEACWKWTAMTVVSSSD